jgi:hypothetical protein
MNTGNEPTLTRVLHELTDVPEPESLADQALSGARRRQRRHFAAAGVCAAAFAVAGALVVPSLLLPDAGPGVRDPGVGAPAPEVAPPKARPRSELSLCKLLPGEPKVEPANWPEFVRITVSRLPQRDDYVLNHGYDVCNPKNTTYYSDDVAAALAVIDLGDHREHGQLMVQLSTPGSPDPATTCEAVRDRIANGRPPGLDPEMRKFLFCTEGTAATPMVYGVRSNTYPTVGIFARYADGRVVAISWVPPSRDRESEIGPDALRPVVTDRALVELLPVT